MSTRFTGFHMFAILVAFFGTVVVVNLTMAGLARSTFGGIVVENSYVASQKFNSWFEQARAQESLGWTVEGEWRGDGRYAVAVTDAPGPVTIIANARHPLGRLPDRVLTFARTGEGRYVSVEPLPPGRWLLRLQVSSAGDEWRSEVALR